jgi:hypothetical protein
VIAGMAGTVLRRRPPAKPSRPVEERDPVYS